MKAFFIMLVICVADTSFSTQAERFVEISVDLEIISYASKTTHGLPIEKRRTYPVRCIVGTNVWRIENEFPTNGKEVWYWDTTNVYESIQITKDDTESRPKSFRSGPVIVPFERAKSNLTVEIIPSPSGHPLGNVGVSIPWTAFCSGTYLKSKGRTIPLPIKPILFEPDSFAYTDRTETFDDELGLPKSVELFTSKSLYESSVKDKRLIRDARVQRARLSPTSPFPDGILKFRYKVVESTNVSGWNFPTRFEYVDYQSDQKGKWRPFVAGSGKVTSIRESAKPNNVFVTGMPTTIVDYRFRHPTGDVQNFDPVGLNERP